MSSLSFGIVFALMAMWVVLWGILGAVISSVRGTDLLIGVSHGTSLGPFGILMLLLDKKNSDKKNQIRRRLLESPLDFRFYRTTNRTLTDE